MENTIPTGYEKEPESSGIYLKIEPNSSVRLRLASAPVMFIDTYKDGTKADKWGWLAIVKGLDESKKVTRTLKVFKAGVSVYKAIRTLAVNDEWGDPSGYDLTISKTGSGKETKYTVVPSPAKPMNDEDKELIASSTIDLSAALTGEAIAASVPQPDYDPFDE